MDLSKVSFLGSAEKVTLLAYQSVQPHSEILAAVISRIAAAILLSSAAALDIAFHSLLVLPALITSQSPMAHIERIRNAVAPLLLGSLLGIIHPFTGIAVSEPTDKHIVIGMTSSNTCQNLETPCSPIHSLSIIEELAEENQFAEKNGIRKEIFPKEYVKIIQETKELEKSLEVLQAQEYIYKITNVTLVTMAGILSGIRDAQLDPSSKEALIRLSGILIPILTIVDTAIAFIAHTFFIATGVARCLTGRGPIYTEVTTNPLMHITFFIQTLIKGVGNLIGTAVWFVSPMDGFAVSLFPAITFFNMQMNRLIEEIKEKMNSAKEKDRFVVPILFGEGECSALSVPTHSSHKTYLIVSKRQGAFNLFWVNRPNVTARIGLSRETALSQIQSMLKERFPFMDMDKMMNYPVESKKPEFIGETLQHIQAQGNKTNCVVSNLFGTFVALDRIRGEDLADWRYPAVRDALVKKYAFYEDDFFPFTEELSLQPIWEKNLRFPAAAI